MKPIAFAFLAAGLFAETWNNPPKSLPAGVEHKTFMSESMKVEVGYNLDLPDDREEGGPRGGGLLEGRAGRAALRFQVPGALLLGDRLRRGPRDGGRAQEGAARRLQADAQRRHRAVRRDVGLGLREEERG